jgi:hypothetical protein
VIRFLRTLAALEDQRYRFIPSRRAGAQDGFGAWLHRRANLGPEARGGRAERLVFSDAQGRSVGVVVEEEKITAPAKPHRVARREHDAKGDLQALRPVLGWPERVMRPIKRTDAFAHGAAAMHDRLEWRAVRKGQVQWQLGITTTREVGIGCPRRARAAGSTTVVLPTTR